MHDVCSSRYRGAWRWRKGGCRACATNEVLEHRRLLLTGVHQWYPCLTKWVRAIAPICSCVKEESSLHRHGGETLGT